MVGWKHGNAKYLFSCREMKVFEGTSGDKQKCVNALETKNIDILAWKCTFFGNRRWLVGSKGTQNIDFLAGK